MRPWWPAADGYTVDEDGDVWDGNNWHQKTEDILKLYKTAIGAGPSNMEVVANFSWHCQLGGIEKRSLRIARRLKSLGYTVVFLHFDPAHDASDEIKQMFANESIDVENVFGLLAQQVANRLKALGVTVILSRNYVSDKLIGHNPKCFEGFKRVMSLHGTWLEASRDEWEDWEDDFRKAAAAADRILAMCPMLQDPLFLEHAGDRNILNKRWKGDYGVEVVHSSEGVWSRGDLGLRDKPKGAITFAQFTRLVGEKGWQISADVIGKLNKTVTPAELLLFGNGNEFQNVHDALQDRDEVQVHPPVSPVSGCRDMFEVSIHPSRHVGEVGPIVPLEMSAMGKILVGTDNANTKRFAANVGLIVDWECKTDDEIAEAMYQIIVSVLYDGNKQQLWNKISRRGAAARVYQRSYHTIDTLAAPYVNGLLSF